MRNSHEAQFAFPGLMLLVVILYYRLLANRNIRQIVTLINTLKIYTTNIQSATGLSDYKGKGAGLTNYRSSLLKVTTEKNDERRQFQYLQ